MGKQDDTSGFSMKGEANYVDADQGWGPMDRRWARYIGPYGCPVTCYHAIL